MGTGTFMSGAIPSLFLVGLMIFVFAGNNAKKILILVRGNIVNHYYQFKWLKKRNTNKQNRLKNAMGCPENGGGRTPNNRVRVDALAGPAAAAELLGGGGCELQQCQGNDGRGGPKLALVSRLDDEVHDKARAHVVAATQHQQHLVGACPHALVCLREAANSRFGSRYNGRMQALRHWRRVLGLHRGHNLSEKKTIRRSKKTFFYFMYS